MWFILVVNFSPEINYEKLIFFKKNDNKRAVPKSLPFFIIFFKKKLIFHN